MFKYLVSLILTVVGLWGQTPPSAYNFQAPSPNRVTQISTSRTGAAGSATYYYYIIAVYPIGSSTISVGTLANNAPNTLTGSNFITVSWAGTGATSYTVVRLTTSTFPSGGCTNCLKATGIAGTTYVDNSNATIGGFNPSPTPVATGNITLNNLNYVRPRFIWNGTPPFDLDFTKAINVFLPGGSASTCTNIAGGLVPVPPNDPTKFLNGQCVFAVPASTAGLTDPGANGIVVRTALNITAARTLLAGTNITVSNGNGVAGNPSVSVTNNSTAVNGQTCTLGLTCTVTAVPSGAANGDLNGTYPNPTVDNGSNIINASIKNSGLVNPATTVNGQTCTLGSTCTVTGAPTGAAGGDLGGTYPNPTVTSGAHITNSSLPNSGLVNTGTTVNGQTCTLGSTCTVTAGPTGAAGGVLSGTYPNPGLATSVAIPGSPTTTTQAPLDNSTKVATTAYVDAASANDITNGGTPLTPGKLPKAGTSPAIVDSNLAENADGSDNASKALTYASPSAPTFNAGGTTTCDFSASNVCGFTMTGGNTTLAVSNPHGSGPYLLKITQDGTGGRTVAYPGSFNNVCAPSLTGSTTTNILILFDGSSTYYEIACTSNDAPTLIQGPTRLPDSTTTALNGKLVFAGPAGTTEYYANNVANRHIMPRTAGSTDQLACADLSNGAAGCSAAALPPNGSAGGDLTGTYPNPGVAKINGTAFAGTTGNVVSFGASNTPADTGFLASNVLQKNAANLGTAAFTLNLTSTQGGQILYGPQNPSVSDTDAICAATAGTPACPAGAILVSGTNEASFAANIALPANGLGTANRALRVVFGLDSGSATTLPNIVFRLRACPTANYTAGNATACSSGGALLWTSNSGTSGGVSGTTNPGVIEFLIQGDGANHLYTSPIVSSFRTWVGATDQATKVSFTTSSAWTLYLTITYSAANAGNWVRQVSLIPNYIN